MEQQEKNNKLHISVRNLVEFIFREGDIDNRSGKLQTAEAMMEGTRLHKKIQKAQGDNYQAEVPLKITIHEPLYELTIDGRADGIFVSADILTDADDGLKIERKLSVDRDDLANNEEIVFIDEIKGIYRNLDHLQEPVFVHQAQAMCYAYIYATQNMLSRIGVRMSYCNLDTEEMKYFSFVYTYAELEEWFEKLTFEYKKWAEFEIKWKKIRQESISRCFDEGSSSL